MNPHDLDKDHELVDEGPMAFPVDRRDFLRSGAAGLFVLFFVDRAGALQEPARLPAGRQGYPTDFNAYLHVKADGRVTCLVGKIEMGQGVSTSLAQLLAEEMDVPLTSVDIVLGDTDLCPWDMGTFGSLSIRQFGPVLKDAAAEARAVLLLMAAERLQVPAERLAVKAGVISDRADPKKSVSYAALTQGQRIERHLGTKPTLKPLASYSVVGTSAPRRDALEKVTGRAKFAGDIVPPGGALHARILRPPAHGAVLASVDTSAAEKMAGVRVVRDGDMVAVLHEHRDEADRALAAVKAEFTRHDPPVDDKTIFEHLVKAAPAPQTPAQGGTLASGEAAATAVLEQTWLDGYVAHAPMEPHAAVAAVEGGKVTVWAGTQTPFSLKNQVMQGLKLPAEKVRVITAYVGGGFGGKSASQAGRRGGAAGGPHRQTGARAVEPGGGVLLRHLPAGGGDQDQVRRSTRRSALRSGTTTSWRPANGGPRTSTTSPTTGRWSGAAGAEGRRLDSTPSLSAPGGHPAPAPTRSRGSRRSTCSPRGLRWTRWSSG